MTRADRPQDERALRCPYCGGALTIDCEYVGRAYLAENRPESITCGDCDARWEPDGTFREPARWVSFPDLYRPPAPPGDVGPARGVHEVSAILPSARPSEPDDKEDTMKVRFPRRVRQHLSGSQCAFDTTEPDYDVFQRVLTPKARKDGSVVVDLDDDERQALVLYVDVMAIGAADNTGADNDPADRADALADLNAARAALRQLQATPVEA